MKPNALTAERAGRANGWGAYAGTAADARAGGGGAAAGDADATGDAEAEVRVGLSSGVSVGRSGVPVGGAAGVADGRDGAGAGSARKMPRRSSVGAAEAAVWVGAAGGGAVCAVCAGMKTPRDSCEDGPEDHSPQRGRSGGVRSSEGEDLVMR